MFSWFRKGEKRRKYRIVFRLLRRGNQIYSDSSFMKDVLGLCSTYGAKVDSYRSYTSMGEVDIKLICKENDIHDILQELSLVSRVESFEKAYY